MRVFVGTNFGHDSAAAAMAENGQLLYAVEEGRLIGRRDHSGFPSGALAQIADLYGDRVAGWSEGWHAKRRLFIKGLGTSARFGWRDHRYLRERLVRECRRFGSGLVEYGRWRNRLGGVRYAGHHEAHAFSLLPWGLPRDSLVFVSDYVGERWSISCFHWGRAGMRPLDRVPFPHSLGAAYQQLATHLGFLGSTGAGKVMALAAYGEPRWVPLLNELVRWEDGSPRIDQRRFPLWWRRRAWSELGEAIGGDLRAEVHSARGNWERGRDLAASVQQWFADTTWRYVSHWTRSARSVLSLPVNALGLAGGCALNCQANGDLLRRAGELAIERVVISPWSGDSGTAIGSAVHAAFTAIPSIDIQTSSPFLGPSISDDASEISGEALSKAVRVLDEGGIVALAEGRLEFGPRALGGRCLLGDPRRPEMRRRLNEVKGRPTYMPFAPAVLAERCGQYFSGQGSTNMAWTVRILPEARAELPGMDHASGQARVQVVPPGGPSALRQLLRSWERHTSCGVLLLTSLNGPGEAIPDTAERATTVARRLGVCGILLDGSWLPLP